MSYEYLPASPSINQLNAGVSVNIVDRVRPSFNVLYSFAQRDPLSKYNLLQTVTGLRYTSGCKCWTLDLTWVHRPLTWRNDDRVMAVLTLTGLGSVGTP